MELQLWSIAGMRHQIPPGAADYFTTQRVRSEKEQRVLRGAPSFSQSCTFGFQQGIGNIAGCQY